MSLYPRLMKFVSEQPWALRRDKLAIMADVLRFRTDGGRLSDADIRDRIKAYGSGRLEAAVDRFYEPDSDAVYAPAFDAEGGSLGYRSEAGAPMPQGRAVVAVMGVVGIVSQRSDPMEEMSGGGGFSLERFTPRFRNALNDPAVKAIVLDVDSPGGGVYGVQELADEIREARSIKPVYATANSLAASAAYWILSAAAEASVTRSGEVGSIGVYSMHQDFSEYLQKEGIKYEFISAGDFKTEGNPFQPLTEEARAYMQQRVDDYYQSFLKAVAKGRGVPVAQVKADFGQGRVVGADQAKAAGMVDRIETLDETIRRAAGKKGTSSAKALATAPGDAQLVPAAVSPWAELNAAQVDADRLILNLP